MILEIGEIMLWNKILKNEFWVHTSIETFVIGAILLVIDIFNEDRLPFLLNAFDPPYLAIIMTVFGFYSLIVSMTEINFLVIVGSAAIWAFVGIGSFLEIFNQESRFFVMPSLLTAISVVIISRILFNAYKTTLQTRKVRDK